LDVVEVPPLTATAPPVPLSEAKLVTLTPWPAMEFKVTAPAASQLKMLVESCFSASVDDAS
jgi:hypothetical protein